MERGTDSSLLAEALLGCQGCGLDEVVSPDFWHDLALEPFCVNGPDNEGRCVGHVEAEAPGIQ